MPQKSLYQALAYKITTHNWDAQEELQLVNSEYEYAVTQFQGTAFYSDYKCYLIKGWEWESRGPVAHEKKVKYVFVAKLTNISEVKILNVLSHDGFKVPAVSYAITAPKAPQTVMMYLEYIRGKELFEINTREAWISTAKAIASIHRYYWNSGKNASPQVPNNRYWNELTAADRKVPMAIFSERINVVNDCSREKKLWRNAAIKIFERMKSAPKTLLHGDLFPTNIIIANSGVPYFIDWANAGEFPYFMDMGRFTGLIKGSSKEMLCKYSEDVCHTYFDEIKDLLNCTYDDFMKDIYMGQFVEMMHCYQPPVMGFRVDNITNSTIADQLDELAQLIMN